MRAQDFSHYSQLNSDIDSYIVNLLSDELKSCFNSVNITEYISCKQGDVALKVEVSIDDRSSTELKMHDVCKRVENKNQCGVQYEIKSDYFDDRTFLVTLFSAELANQAETDNAYQDEDSQYEVVQDFPMQVISL